MYVLSRRVGESLMIGHDVKITVLDIRDDRVLIGTTAPNETAIHRDEIFQSYQMTNCVMKTAA